MQQYGAKPVTVAPGAEEAAQVRIRLYAEQLVVVNHQLKAAKKAIMDLIMDLSANGESSDTPSDAAILLSMPGVGPTVASVLLSEAPRLLLLRDYRDTAVCIRRTGRGRPGAGESHRGTANFESGGSRSIIDIITGRDS